jgi:hypothetical protein
VSETPLTDAVLATPIEVPPGLGSALQNVERGARAARARLQPVADRGDAAPAVIAALARLDAFLDDRRSPLRRALRRPLRQIALGTPAWRRVESAWRAAVLRADAAARLQGAIEELRGEVARITARFGAEMPYWTRWHLEREHVAAADVERVRREDALKPMRERLRRAEAELARLHAHLPPPHVLDAVQLADAWPSDVAPGELLAAAALRLAERTEASVRRSAAAPLRSAAARHLHALGAAEGWSRVASQPAHSVAEQLANSSLSADEERWVDDAPLWTGLVAASQDGLHGGEGRDEWQPQLLARKPVEPDEGWGATHFAIPISPDYVLLTPETQSAVRVTSRRIKLDASAECAAFSGRDGFETLADARRDVDPLFAGLADEPAWYRTTQSARVTVLARSGALWLARLDLRGEIGRAPVAAWSTGAPRDARLRVLLDGVSAPPPDPVAVDAAGAEPAAELGGIALHEVEAPYAAHRRLWLKTAGEGDGDRLDAEHALFRRIARHAPEIGLRPMGRGRTERPPAEGYLYIPPFAFTAAGSPPLARWMRESPIAFIAAAARASAALTRTGWALGVFHRDAFAFRVEWSAAGVARPVAVIIMAPYAVPLGHYHARTGLQLVPGYGGLGGLVLPHALAAGDVAMPETEAQAWALFGLDLLARKRLPPTVRTPAAIASLAAESAGDYFDSPKYAAALAAALCNGEWALTLLEQRARAG